MFSLRQIRYFIGVAEAGQVSRAARALNVSQSAVTLAVKDLEGQLGVTLFDRHSGGLALTLDGHRFLQHARNIQGSVADAMNSMRTDFVDVAGHVRLGLSYMMSGYFIFPVLARFRRAYPDIHFELVELDRIALEDAVRGGTVDVALLLTSNLEDRATIECTTFHQSPRRLWLSSAHPLLERDAVSFADIANEAYVMHTMDEADQSAHKYWNTAGLEPQVTYTTGSLEAVRSMVANGFAVTILSDMVYRPWSLDGGRIVKRDIAAALPSMDMGIAWKKGRTLSPPEQTFFDYLAEQG
ncbi:MAG: LysR family transcriptional regulator [Pseudomonadota bacterium]